MSITWVGGSSFTQSTGTSHAATSPSGLANGDLLLAAVIARSTITPPSGWALVHQSADFTDGISTQRLAVYRKNSTASGDSSTSFTWSQASSAPIGVVYAAARNADASPSVSSTTVDEFSFPVLSIAPNNIAATQNGQLMIIFASTVEGDPAGGNPAAPSLFTLFSGATASDYRLAGAYRSVNTGQGVSDDFSMDADLLGMIGDETPGLAAVTLLLDEAGFTAWIAADSPLGAPAMTGHVRIVGFASAPSPLGTPAILGWHNIGAAVNSDGPGLFFMDLVTPDGPVRAPISSWQGTLQTASAQYVQCVVPNCAAFVDDIEAATSFRIWRRLRLLDGGTVDYLVAEPPLEDVQIARGSTNHTATLSGYLDAAPVVAWPPGTARTLTGVQTIFTYSSGKRVRCAIDWLLQPGQEAIVEGVPFTVSYINYIFGDGSAYMDVGERLEPV